MFKRLRASERGASAVEFALVLPFVLLLIFGLIDFGRLYWAKMSVVAAANESVRAVILDSTLADTVVEQRAEAVAAPWSASAISVTVIRCPSPPTSTSVAEVKVLLNFNFITPVGQLMQAFGAANPGRTRTISSTGIYRCLV